MRITQKRLSEIIQEELQEGAWDFLKKGYQAVTGGLDLSKSKNSAGVSNAAISAVEPVIATGIKAVQKNLQGKAKKLNTNLAGARDSRIARAGGGAFTNVRAGESKRHTVPGMTDDKAAQIKADNEKAWQNQQSGKNPVPVVADKVEPVASIPKETPASVPVEKIKSIPIAQVIRKGPAAPGESALFREDLLNMIREEIGNVVKEAGELSGQSQEQAQLRAPNTPNEDSKNAKELTNEENLDDPLNESQFVDIVRHEIASLFGKTK